MKKIISLFVTFIIILECVSVSSPNVNAAASVDIADGCYILVSGLSDMKCLDVSGAGIKDGTNIQLWETNGTFAQMFFITKVSSNWYSIRNIESRKAVDVAGGAKGNSVNVQLYSWNGTDAQLWQFFDGGNGYYTIKNKLGYCLDVSGGNSSNGTNVQTYQSNGTRAQMWRLELANGVYSFKSKLSASKCMDVSGAGETNGTNIHLWTENQTIAQFFYISRIESCWYSIRNIASNKAVDVTGGVGGNCVNVQLYEWNGTDAQLWRFISAGNGYYYIQNKLGYYLDVSGGNTSDGTNIQTYKGNSTRAQMWKPELVDLTNKILSYVIVNLYQDTILYNPEYNYYYMLERLAFYYKCFNHNRKYDIKRDARWNEFFSGNTAIGDISFPGFTSVILFDQMIITPEQLGNVIYGLSGNYLGFSDRTIYQGGGYAANGTKYLNNASMFYGDSEIDHYFISIGIKMINKTPECDIDISQISWLLPYAKLIME